APPPRRRYRGMGPQARLRPRRSLLWNRLLRVRYAELCMTGDRSGQRVSVTYRGDRGGEIAAVAVALARILDQRGLDQCTYATGRSEERRVGRVGGGWGVLG